MKTLAEMVCRFCELVDPAYIPVKRVLQKDGVYADMEIIRANIQEAHTLLRDMEQQAKRDMAFRAETLKRYEENKQP